MTGASFTPRDPRRRRRDRSALPLVFTALAIAVVAVGGYFLVTRPHAAKPPAVASVSSATASAASQPGSGASPSLRRREAERGLARAPGGCPG
jgi:hypothetical protein